MELGHYKLVALTVLPQRPYACGLGCCSFGTIFTSLAGPLFLGSGSGDVLVASCVLGLGTGGA